ncbi:unnamed protein product, partial [Prorocentrum cordatum]
MDAAGDRRPAAAAAAAPPPSLPRAVCLCRRTTSRVGRAGGPAWHNAPPLPAGDAHDAAKHHAQKAAGHVANAVGAAWGALAGAFGGGGGNSEERALEQQPPQASRTQPGLLVARDPVPPAQDKPTLSLQGKPAAVLPAWSQAQRAWCCENRGVGCTTTTPKC